ncbi:MAG TPA: SDR family oxidoreductase [Acidimicrobiales bacterium]|jgi:NAD(P)-dependent dehydrogenase (short-subunit alcohol dehydrogenase family)|nr:SDR family oxidoreductase [Acidimicrobiales bacterium]
MGTLSGQVALVTGCGRYAGLGRGIARKLAANGADVAVTDLVPGGTRNVHEDGEQDAAASWLGLPSLVEELEGMGVRSTGLVGDVGEKADAERMVAETIGTLGQVDILVNNAAAPHGADRNWTWNVPEEAFDLVMRVNTKGVFLLSSAVVRHLLDRKAPGRIINIASGSGRRGYPQRGAYSASKFAVVGLTQVMAQELAASGITVNAVCPGAMDTPRQSHTKPAPADAPGADSPIPTVPVGRLGQPEDIARAVEFLADPAASYITGECLNVNGGVLMV